MFQGVPQSTSIVFQVAYVADICWVYGFGDHTNDCFVVADPGRLGFCFFLGRDNDVPRVRGPSLPSSSPDSWTQILAETIGL
jgi:hypothetical protein